MLFLLFIVFYWPSNPDVFCYLLYIFYIFYLPGNPHADLFPRLASCLPCKVAVASAKWKYQVNIKHFSLAFPHCIQIQFEFLYSYSFQDSSYFNHLKTERNGLIKWFSICVVFISVFFNICRFVLFKAFFVLILR